MAEHMEQIPKPKKKNFFMRFMRWIFIILFLLFGFFFWWNYFFVFGEGVKSGELNYVVKKGNLFKTYEGKLIQSGLKSKAPGTVQSFEFDFSISDDSIAKVLMLNSGKYFDLHYKEYKSSLPWRGYSKYIVDKIVDMENIEH